MRMVLVTAAFVLALAGCEGSDDEPKPSPTTTTTTTTTSAKVSLAETCPRIQLALDAAFEGDTVSEEDMYQRFADDLTLLAARVDPKDDVRVLNGLVEASKDSVQIRKAGAPASRVREVDQDWVAAMDRVLDACEQLGAPAR